MSNQRIAIVTGGNKGIGYAIVKGLCEKYDGFIYLTSRDTKRGLDAIKKLNDLGFNPKFHQLDIDDQASVDKFKEYILGEHGGIDLLINNAAIAFNMNATEEFGYQAEMTIKSNYFGTLRVCDALFPMLRQNAQVVNISSSSGHLAKIPSQELRAKFSNPKLTVTELSSLMKQFVKAAQQGSNINDGWGTSTYNVSKVGVCALTRIQQREFDEKRSNLNISVNSVHPGYVDTDMTNHTGPLTIEEGAVAPLYLALEPHGLKGEYVWRDCSVVDWLGPTLPAPV